MTTVEDATSKTRDCTRQRRRSARSILERPRATTGRVELVHDRRPQEDRDHVRHDRDVLLPRRRHRGAVDPPAARAARRHHAHRRPRTTSSSRCTARRWCSSWACRIAAAFGNYLVPLMIGARDVAFPRLNMLGFWVFLFGGMFIYSSFVARRRARTAAGSATRRSRARRCRTGFLPGRGPDFWAVGLIMLGIGSVATAVNFIVTDLNMRAPGMTMMRMPVFVWMMLVVAFLTLFAMPPRHRRADQVFMDRNFHTNFFNAAAGGDPLLYQNLFWIFGHPEVYILILPGMGIVSEILPVFSRKPLFGYSVVVFSGIAIGFLGWGVWAHHMFVTGIGPVARLGVRPLDDAHRDPDRREDLQLARHGVGRRGAACRRRCCSRSASSRSSRSAASRASCTRSCRPTRSRPTPTSSSRTSTTCCSAASCSRSSAASTTGGRRSSARCSTRRLGKLNFWLMVIGFNLTFFPMHFLGFEGQPRRTYTYPKGMGWDALNLLATIGAFIIALSVLVFLVNVIYTAAARRAARRTTRGTRARSSGSTSSPPPEYNFAEVPIVDAPRRVLAPQVHRGRRGPAREAAAGRRRRRDRRTARPGRAAQHPHAVAVVLAAGLRARPADHGLRLRVQELVARSRSACSSRSSGSTGGRSNRRPSPTSRRRSH